MKRSSLSLAIALVCAAGIAQVSASPTPAEILQDADDFTAEPGVSPVRRIERGPAPAPEPTTPLPQRSIDGAGNNPNDEDMGATHVQLQRYLSVDYSDGISAMAGEDRPSPREISNALNAQSTDLPNARGATDFLWQWGQFLDHDVDLTDGADPAESADIEIPAGDAWFDPSGTGSQTMSVNRSAYDDTSGDSVDNPRQQINEITSWIDASNVYGSDSVRAAALRTNDGTGMLATSEGDLLPFNTEGLANAGGSSDSLFLAGDVRANEQVGLMSMHTLFVREHNRIAALIAERLPEWSGEQIYQAARAEVGALMQSITYREFLPLLLGPTALSPYQGYDPDVDASIANSFSTGAYRLGHSLLSTRIKRLGPDGETIAEGDLALRDAFFNPAALSATGIDPVLRGLAAQACQDLDVYVVDDVRNFLFGLPGAGGFDLASLNIQRGRDHGLPDYNSARVDLGLEPVTSFAQITSDEELQAKLAAVYGSVDNIDLWIGGLAEDDVTGAMVGPTFFSILKTQFEALRDGDRFWYQIALPRDVRERVERTRLSDLIRRNTAIGAELPDDVFRIGAVDPQPQPGPRPGGPRPPRR